MSIDKVKKPILRPDNKSKAHFNPASKGTSKKPIVKPNNKSKATPINILNSKDQLIIDLGLNFNEFCNYVKYFLGQPSVKRMPNLENTETTQSRINLIEKAFEDILTFYLNKNYCQPREVTKNLFKKYAFGTIGPVIPEDIGRLNSDKVSAARLFFDYGDIKLNLDSRQAQKNMWELISNTGSSSGWDKDHDTIENLANTNDIFNKIEGRTRTRYGYETNTFLQGPHTIARIFGYKLRKELFFRNSEVTIENVDSWFSHLFKTDFNDIMNKHYQLTSWQSSNESKNYTKQGKWCYSLHYQNLIQKYNQSTNVKVRIAYGQLLSDMHPFATASTYFPTRSNIAGGGEGAAIKGLIELLDQINSEDSKISIETEKKYIKSILLFIEKLIDLGGCDHFLTDATLFKKFIRDSTYNNIAIYLVGNRKDLLTSLKTVLNKI